MQFNDVEAKVSIILPIFNAEKTLKRCLDSVLAQSFKNYELICVDDGSHDQSVQICKEYAERHANEISLHLIIQENQGVVSARANGIKVAKGNYLAFLDSDDEFDPNMLLKMVEAMDSNNSDICICGYTCLGLREYSVIPERLQITTNDEYVNALFNHTGVSGFLWNKLYRKELFCDIDYPRNMTICEDLYINCLIALKINKIITVTESLYNYYIYPESASNDIKRKIDSNGDWKYLKAYENIATIFPAGTNARSIVENGFYLVYLYGVIDLEKYKNEYTDTYKKMLKLMRSKWFGCLVSGQSISLKLDYSKNVIKSFLKWK